MQETLTNIYMPSVFRSESLAVPQLEDPSWDMDVNHRVTVFITGSHSGVLAAKEKLINLIITKVSKT